jgi:hypothetical protein
VSDPTDGSWGHSNPFPAKRAGRAYVMGPNHSVTSSAALALHASQPLAEKGVVGLQIPSGTSHMQNSGANSAAVHGPRGSRSFRESVCAHFRSSRHHTARVRRTGLVCFGHSLPSQCGRPPGVMLHAPFLICFPSGEHTSSQGAAHRFHQTS